MIGTAHGTKTGTVHGTRVGTVIATGNVGRARGNSDGAIVGDGSAAWSARGGACGRGGGAAVAVLSAAVAARPRATPPTTAAAAETHQDTSAQFESACPAHMSNVQARCGGTPGWNCRCGSCAMRRA